MRVNKSLILASLLAAVPIYAQVPISTGVQILKAEDARRYDSVLETLMRSPNDDVRARAALAAGRIGDEKAIPILSEMLDKDASTKVRETAAFALGEIGSPKANEALLLSGGQAMPSAVLARRVEAIGKIAADNPRDEGTKALGKAITDGLAAQTAMGAKRDRDVVLLAITAVLRARPEGGDQAVLPFLKDTDARIRADALNTLARLRAKVDTKTLREIVLFDTDDVVRINALRVIAASENKELNNVLISAATSDEDPGIRIAAIRALAALRDDPKGEAADALIERGNKLLIRVHGDPAPLKPGQKVGNIKPVEVPLPKNELLEIAVAIGRLRTNTENGPAIGFLSRFAAADGYTSPETMIAYARVAPNAYLEMATPSEGYKDFRSASAYSQGLAAYADLKNEEMIARAGQKLTRFVAGMPANVKPSDESKMLKAMPDLTQSLAALKPDDLDEILLGQLGNTDPFIRAAAASAIAERPATKENVEALNKAFASALITDKHDNDAQLAILDAIAKLDKKAGVGTFSIALTSPDHIVRKKAFEILGDKDLQNEFPGLPLTLENARNKHKDQVQPYLSAFGTKLGQVLNNDADYRRALSRKNGTIKAVLTTEKGTFTIVFDPEEAPLTVDNFVKLARSGYFNGLAVHRVVPNFVMQDGDSRGDGNGGPGWSIRCEINMLPYDRGAVGMALSGKDTGGSQWFVTHIPQPHLDGGYTVFGKVSENDMKVVDNIARGDKILRVVIIGK